MDCSSSLEIDKPPSDIFAFLYEWENIPLWMAEFQRYEPLEGEEGELNSTSWIFLHLGSSSFRIHQKIRSVEENTSLTVLWTCFLYEIDRCFQIIPNARGGSKLSTHVNVLPRNMIGTFCLPFLSSIIRKRHLRNIDRLKVALEEVTTT